MIWKMSVGWADGSSFGQFALDLKSTKCSSGNSMVSFTPSNVTHDVFEMGQIEKMKLTMLDDD